MTPPVFLAVLDLQGAEAATVWKQRIARRTGLLPVIDTPALAIFVSPGAAWRPLVPAGAIIGKLYQSGTATRVEWPFGDPLEADGKLLAERYWGDYVAISADMDGARVSTFRAPSGGIHAFRARADGVQFVASHIELFCDIEIIKPSIDWEFVAHHLTFSHLHGRATGIAGIDEILPGESAVEAGAASERHVRWSPWSFTVPERRVEDFGEAARHLREVVGHAVTALIEPGAKVALELSGGLDSSIVAAALAAEGRSAVGINLVTPGGDGDERDYARAVSATTRIRLIEAEIDGEIDLTEVEPRIEARPGMLAMLRLADRSLGEVGRKEGVSAFVNGTGGDCVFCSLGSSAPVADKLRAHGIGAGLVRTTRDVARVHDSNFWTVARMAARRARPFRPAPTWPRNHRFLKQELLPPEPAVHHWLDAPRDTLDGPRAHVHAILASTAHLDGYGRHAIAPSLFPLLAQPVVEACLAIPSWLWVAGGRDRAVARAAFLAELPAIVAERRSKGAMDAFCARIFDLNRARLRPFLLDGLIANAGLLDRAAIAAYLARPFTNRDRDFYHLFPIIDTELWARALLGSGR